jgi:hypothetical protein
MNMTYPLFVVHMAFENPDFLASQKNLSAKTHGKNPPKVRQEVIGL